MGAAVPDALLNLDNLEVPSELQCPICQRLFKDASLVPCCGTSYCDQCIRDKLIEDGFVCPSCGTTEMTPDKLGSNKYLREVRAPMPSSLVWTGRPWGRAFASPYFRPRASPGPLPHGAARSLSLPPTPSSLFFVDAHTMRRLRVGGWVRRADRAIGALLGPPSSSGTVATASGAAWLVWTFQAVLRFTVEKRSQIVNDFQQGKLMATPSAKVAPLMPALASASNALPGIGAWWGWTALSLSPRRCGSAQSLRPARRGGRGLFECVRGGMCGCVLWVCTRCNHGRCGPRWNRRCWPPADEPATTAHGPASARGARPAADHSSLRVAERA